MAPERTVPEAWVRIPTDEELRTRVQPGASRHPYDFGFFPAMARLIMAHPRIGPAFGALFHQVMFAPGYLDRRERELVAAVAAAAQDCHY
jgi:alkylhydroperoxidase/carboxymuconolactone decarboxylase family protein YurZ